MAVIQTEYYSMSMCGFISFSAVLPVDLSPTAKQRRSAGEAAP